MENIAVIAENADLRRDIVDCAQAMDYRVFAYHAAQHPDRLIQAHRPALVIAEFSGRKVNGLALTRELRRISDIPVILFSQSLDEVEYVLANQAGADRILSWPASKSMISVTITATLERYHSIRQAGEADTGIITTGNLRMDQRRHYVSWKNREVRLTGTEFRLLARLAARPGTVKSRDDLMGPDCLSHVNDRYVDSHIKRIRSKLKDIDPGFCQIETLYGLGYRYVEDTADEVRALPWPTNVPAQVVRFA